MTISTTNSMDTKKNKDESRNRSSNRQADEEEGMNESQDAPVDTPENRPADSPQHRVIVHKGATIIIDEDLYQRAQCSIKAQKIIAGVLLLAIVAMVVVLFVPRWTNNEYHHPCDGQDFQDLCTEQLGDDCFHYGVTSGYSSFSDEEATNTFLANEMVVNLCLKCDEFHCFYKNR